MPTRTPTATGPATPPGVGPADSTRRPGLGVWPLVIFAGVVLGLGALVAKGLVDDGVDAFTVTWFPFVVGGLIAVAVSGRRAELRAPALLPAVALGVTVSATPPLLFNLGLEDLSAGTVTLIISLGPVFTAVIAHFTMGDEPFNRIKGLGLVAAIVGVALLASGAVDGDGSALAVAMVLAGSITAGSSAVLARHFAVRHGAGALLAPQLVTAGVVVLALALVADRPLAPAGGFDPWHLIGLSAFGVATYLAFLAMMKANEIGTTGQVSVIAYTVPAVGVVGGVIVFGDPVTWTLVLGGLLILVSVRVIAVGSRIPPEG